MSSLLPRRQPYSWQKSAYDWRPLDQDVHVSFVTKAQYDQMAGHACPSRESRPFRRA